MNIAVAANKTFAKYLYVMMTSLLKNNTEKMTIYLLSADMQENQITEIRELVEQYRQELCFLPIDKQMFPEGLPFSDKITLETYFRLALPELLPDNVHRVLYLDVDLIVNQSIVELYTMDLEGKCLGACRDVTFTSAQYLEQSELFAKLIGEEDFQYFNAGILLMDLDKMRREYSFVKLMKIADEIKEYLKFHDQDLLNYVFWKDVKFAEAERFNLAARTAYNSGILYDWVEKNSAIIHYAGPKPWEQKEVRYELEKFWWDYAKETPYYVEFLENIVLVEVNTGYMDKLFRQLNAENMELRGIVDKCMELLQNTLVK